MTKPVALVISFELIPDAAIVPNRPDKDPSIQREWYQRISRLVKARVYKYLLLVVIVSSLKVTPDVESRDSKYEPS